MITKKLFGMISLGCDKNRVDTEKLLGLLKAKGCALTADLSKAQIVIINTCAFLQSSREEAIETIIECAEYKNKNLEQIVVTGCLPQKFIGELFEPLNEADIFLGISDYEKIFDALEYSYATGKRINFVGQGKDNYLFDRVITTDEHYAYLKIADGCYNHCTYCLIPKIRGKYRSYPMEYLLKETQELGEISELILVAQDTTRYGIDLYGKYMLDELIRKICEATSIPWIRLLYCYPDKITDELVAEIRDNPRVVKYIDIPLQHISDPILRRMNRRGRSELIKSVIKKLRDNIPEIAIRTTFIVGFSGETEEDFIQLAEFMKEARFEHAGVFTYSREEGTPAYDFDDQVDEQIKQDRMDILMKSQLEINSQINEAMIGKTVTVLCEDYDPVSETHFGRSQFDAPEIDGKVFFKSEHRIAPGSFVNVKIRNVIEYDLFGFAIKNN